MATYRKKPQDVEAVKWEGTAESLKEICDFIGYIPEVLDGCESEEKWIRVKREGSNNYAILSKGDYVVKEATGEIKVWYSRSFEELFELAEPKTIEKDCNKCMNRYHCDAETAFYCMDEGYNRFKN